MLRVRLRKCGISRGPTSTQLFFVTLCSGYSGESLPPRALDVCSPAQGMSLRAAEACKALRAPAARAMVNLHALLLCPSWRTVNTTSAKVPLLYQEVFEGRLTEEFGNTLVNVGVCQQCSQANEGVYLQATKRDRANPEELKEQRGSVWWPSRGASDAPNSPWLACPSPCVDSHHTLATRLLADTVRVRRARAFNQAYTDRTPKHSAFLSA